MNHRLSITVQRIPDRRSSAAEGAVGKMSYGSSVTVRNDLFTPTTRTRQNCLFGGVNKPVRYASQYKRMSLLLDKSAVSWQTVSAGNR